MMDTGRLHALDATAAKGGRGLSTASTTLHVTRPCGGVGDTSGAPTKGQRRPRRGASSEKQTL